MTTAAITADQLSDLDHRKQLRRAVIASVIGTTIEWYDFFIYGIVTGLVFAKLYFPQSDPLAGTLQAYAIFFVGFVARPIGAAGVLWEDHRAGIGREIDGEVVLPVPAELLQIAAGFVGRHEGRALNHHPYPCA